MKQLKGNRVAGFILGRQTNTNRIQHKHNVSYPAGDLGGPALEPAWPWPDLDCMLMVSIFATGAGPRPGTHSDTSGFHFVSAHCKLNTHGT